MKPALVSIEIVEDRTEGARADEGFLRVRRLLLENRYADGSASRPYACDVVSRRHVDAVAVVLHGRGADGGIWVVLRTGVRPPAWLRREKAIPHADPVPLLLAEIVAGVLEEDDAAPGGVERRAVQECDEEAGYRVQDGAVRPLGGPLFPSPGVTDERVHFRRVEVDLEAGGAPAGDGSVMEEAGDVLVLPLREAIRRCRRGEIPDMKTEVGLMRLADALGYLPAVDRFLHELPAGWAERARALPPLV